MRNLQPTFLWVKTAMSLIITLISVEAALATSSQARGEQLSLSDKLAHIVSILLLLIYLVPVIMQAVSYPLAPLLWKLRRRH